MTQDFEKGENILETQVVFAVQLSWRLLEEGSPEEGPARVIVWRPAASGIRWRRRFRRQSEVNGLGMGCVHCLCTGKSLVLHTRASPSGPWSRPWVELI